ncbi:MAG: hypothetical protein JNL79_03050 [Myxococcales bacterium]|nr:hypothetical protein [Myxococcales bacterium]
MVHAFVFGALMVHRRALEHGEAAVVRDHAVRFVVRGARHEPSFASLVEAPGEEAWGVVVPFQSLEWMMVRMREAVYRARPVLARTKSGREVRCHALFVFSMMRVDERPPSARYARLLLRGALHHGLPTHVVDRYRVFAQLTSA